MRPELGQIAAHRRARRTGAARRARGARQPRPRHARVPARAGDELRRARACDRRVSSGVACCAARPSRSSQRRRPPPRAASARPIAMAGSRARPPRSVCSVTARAAQGSSARDAAGPAQRHSSTCRSGRAALSRTADRIGLLVTGDLPLARRLAIECGAADDDLVEFAISAAHLRLRTELGLSIDV